MTIPDLEEQLRAMKSKVEVPKGLAKRIVASVSERARKRQRRKLAWEYLVHGFSSVVVAFFIIRLIAPAFTTPSMMIGGAIILSMFWMLFRVARQQNSHHYGGMAFSAATFGLVLASAGLFSLNLELPTELDDLNMIESKPVILEEAADESLESNVNVLEPMTEDISPDEMEGSGIFGEILEINTDTTDEFVQFHLSLDNGKEVYVPMKKPLYQKLKDKFAVGDRIYLEGQFIQPVNEPFDPGKTNTQGTSYLES